MVGNPLLQLKAFDQSIWIDFIRRGMISSGQLQRLQLCGRDMGAQSR
jgi:hypothetical protein